MNLFNILCVPDKPSVTDHITILFIFLGCLLFIYGLINVCKNVIDYKKEPKAKKKCKIGLVSIFISIAMIASSVLLNPDFFLDSDPCNSYGPVFGVLRGMIGLAKLFFPLYYIIKAVISMIRMLKYKGVERKKYRNQIITNLLVAIMMFFALTFIDILLGLVKIGTLEGQCWC